MTQQIALRPGDETPLQMLDRTVAELADDPLVHWFETPLSARRIDLLADGLAVALQDQGVTRGDRVALYMQNDPQYLIAMLAAWRLGAIIVACNPMLRRRELAHLLEDSKPVAVIALNEILDTARQAMQHVIGVRVLIGTGATDLREDCTRPESDLTPAGVHDLVTLAERHAGAAYDRCAPAPENVAVLTYTSGTTGPAKGAMNTHANIAFVSRLYREWLGIGRADAILGISPLFHVTGLTAHIGLSLASGAPIVLAHRFDPTVVAGLIERHRATVTVAAITAYIALANHDAASAHDLSSLRRPYSGGAPVPPAVVEFLRARIGLTIRPVYGLTETTGPCHICPPDIDPPLDPETGALSVGPAAPLTRARIVGEDGETLEAGEVGEVAVSGPQVVPGYWQRPEESAAAIRDGELLTGDVGVIDEEGWLYLVDRRKETPTGKILRRELRDSRPVT
jgi:long-chain acyl-CoA synthetase